MAAVPAPPPVTVVGLSVVLLILAPPLIDQLENLYPEIGTAVTAGVVATPAWVLVTVSPPTWNVPLPLGEATNVTVDLFSDHAA